MREHKAPARFEHCILVYIPGGKDAQIAAQVLEAAGIVACVCADHGQLMSEIESGAGALITVEEALTPGLLATLGQYVAGQATWSDLPILVMTYQGADSVGLDDTVRVLGNVTLLERPVRTAALTSAVRSALRARTRQYQVREADRRKDEFLASLGHELRNPLGPIRTSMLVLKRMYPGAASVTQVRETVERQVSHLTRLVDDLLDVARITSGKVELQRESIALAGVVTHAVEICMPLLQAGEHKIEIVQPEEKILLDADPVRLVQSLANVIANAVKYTLEPSTIHLRVSVADKTVTFSVRDSGIGMEADSLSRIFDMFVQNNPVPGRILGGLGIGLSLARQFTEMHGGSIRAKSDGLGKGSEIILELPVVIPCPSGKNAGPHAIAEESIKAHNRKVLVVDDNHDGADILQLLLQADGFSATTAYDGLQAVETVKRSQPDIVVMDIGMPGMDGYEAARHIRSQPGGENILMIALTGWGQESARQLTAEAGFDHHMVKPVNFDVLKNFLDHASG
ncbi:hypothetical protein BH11PSE11_BH11PSE11_22210 [soil metagenome]